MGNKTIGAKIVLEGEAEYRKALKNINTEQKELRSEMKLCSSTYHDQQNSIEALTKKQEILSKQYDTQKSKVEIYSKAVAEAADKEEKAGNKVDELKTALEQARKKMEEMATSSDTSVEALEEQNKAVADLEQKLSLAEDGYSKAKNATNDWKTSLNNAQSDLTQLGAGIEQNKKYMKEAESSMNGCASSIDEYGKEVVDASEKTSVFGDVLVANLTGEAIRKGVDVIVNSIKKITTASIEVGTSFESSMSQVAATMGITAEEIAAGSEDFNILKKAAEDCGKSTKFSATQSAEALNYLALAGYDAAKSAEVLPKVLNLAAAGGLELATASDMVTDAMAALNMETSEVDKYIDEMAKTSQKSNTSVAQLGEATLVCAGAVSMTKMPLETMNAELGILANNGLKGAEGGTHLRNIIMSLVSPTDKGSKALKRLGVSVTDTNGNIRDMNTIMTELNKSLGKMSDSDKTNIISNIFNKTDIAAVNALLKGTGDEFNNLYEELNSCSGAAENMAETMEDNLNGKITILNSALEGLGITAYEKIEGTLKNSVDAATDSVGRLQDSMDRGELGRSMDDFADSLGNVAEGAISFAEDALPALIDGLTWVMDNADIVAIGIGSITAAEVYHGTVAPMIMATMEAWKAYKTANEGATIAQWALNTAMNANPVGLLTTALVGLTTAVGVYAIATGGAFTETQKFVKASKDVTDNINSNIDARKLNQEEQKAEISTIRALKDELLELNEKESLSNEEKNKMLMIVQDLNEAMPELNLAIDEQTGHLAMTNQELDTYIDNMLRTLELGFMEEDLTQIAKDHYEAKKNLAEIEEKYADVQRQATELQEGWAKACEEGTDAMNDFMSTTGTGEEASNLYAGSLHSLKTEMDELKEAMDEASSTTQNLEDEFNNMQTKLDDSKKGFEEAAEATEQLAKKSIEYKDSTYEVSQTVAANIDSICDAYNDAYEKAYESLSGQVKLFQELKTESELTAEQMATNLKSQTTAFTQYKDDLLTASDLVKKGLLNEGLLGAIQELGMDGAGYLHELVIASEQDTEALNKVMEEWAEMSEAKATLTNTMADLASGYSKQMDEILGIQNESNENMITGMDYVTKKVHEIVDQSILDVVGTTGTGFDDVTKTITEKTPDVTKATEGLGSGAIEGIKQALGIANNKSATMESIGNSIPEGIAQGIIDGQGLVDQALQQTINNAVDNIDLSRLTSKINRELGDMY